MARTTSRSLPIDRSSAQRMREALSELSMVVLTAPVTSRDGRVLPPGSRGAVVFAHGDGAAYEVEFSTFFRSVLTVEARQLREAEPV